MLQAAIDRIYNNWDMLASGASVAMMAWSLFALLRALCYRTPYSRETEWFLKAMDKADSWLSNTDGVYRIEPSICINWVDGTIWTDGVCVTDLFSKRDRKAIFARARRLKAELLALKKQSAKELAVETLQGLVRCHSADNFSSGGNL